ncbi:MAG TPA: tetratricopeptide repeat protein [Acidobacteriaceae bacterium]|jgi:serine/threonine-protein kinase|nr:tetratricopeptide repeat protein [Acidobacteriaceae bacterium]
MTQFVSSRRTLPELLRVGPLQSNQAFSIAAQVGRELSAAHEAGSIHGYLTSACVQLSTESGGLRARIAGFGAESPTSDSVSQMAPELRLGRPATVAADVYGFGVILADLAAAVSAPGLGTRWQEAVRRCLEPEPGHRFTSIAAVFDALQIPPDPEQTSALPPLGPAPAEPRQWGDFQLLQRLGQGAFGEVWRAWDPVLEREVALKLLLPRGQHPEQELATVVAEARAMARVRHPNIVPVYGVDRREGRVGFWSDFVRGCTLSQRVRGDGVLTARETLSTGSELCQALAAVHHAGLLHRDIKASNAMLDEDGRVLLMDFGLSQDLQIAGDIAGTPNYMAPEVRAGQPQTVQSDVYALGVLLLFLATGLYPLSADREASDPVAWKLTGDDPSVASLRTVIATATHSDPQQRFAGAAAMGQALTAALEAKPAAAGPALPPPRRRLAAWLGGGLGVLVLVGLALVFLLPRIRPKVVGEPTAGSPAYQDYLSAEAALDRYDKPGNTQKAIALFKTTLGRAPDFALAQAGLARADWRMYIDTSDSNWAKQATQAAAKADQINPSLAPVQMTLGNIHVDQGQFGLGMQELQKALSLDPHSADVHAALAEAYRQQGRLADAKNEYQTAMDLSPDAWRWPYLLGAMQIDSGDYSGAEASLQSALQNTPDNARVLYDLGLAYRKQGRYADARSAYENAIALDPRGDTLMALGAVMLLQGDSADAVRQYRRAVSLDPDNWNAWGNLAAALSWQSASPQSLRTYEKAIALGEVQLRTTPDDPYLLSLLGNYFAALHQPQKALPLVRKSLALSPNDPDVQELAAESYEMLGHRQEALQYLAKALQLGFSADYAKKNPAFRALRRDPHAPRQIQK